MSRLIDADELMDVILRSKKLNSECVLAENAVDTYDNGQQETFELVIKMLEDRPTAYDADKVVEKLKHNIIGQLGRDGVIRIPLDKAIKIVEGGGMTG